MALKRPAPRRGTMSASRMASFSRLCYADEHENKGRVLPVGKEIAKNSGRSRESEVLLPENQV